MFLNEDKGTKSAKQADYGSNKPRLQLIIDQTKRKSLDHSAISKFDDTESGKNSEGSGKSRESSDRIADAILEELASLKPTVGQSRIEEITGRIVEILEVGQWPPKNPRPPPPKPDREPKPKQKPLSVPSSSGNPKNHTTLGRNAEETFRSGLECWSSGSIRVLDRKDADIYAVEEDDKGHATESKPPRKPGLPWYPTPPPPPTT